MTHWKHDDFPTISPALPGGRRLIEFMEAVFDAKVQARYDAGPDKVAHAEIRVGDSVVMTGDPTGSETLHAATVSIYVPDVDATYAKALEHGARSTQAPTDQFHGDRSARIVDPFGNHWAIATHVRDVPREELDRHMAAMAEHAS